MRSARPTRSLSSGAATTLIKVAGLSILTDPNFLHRGDRAYVGMGLTTKRLTEPALSVQQLPGLDFIVLSHHHGDHFDRIAARDFDHDVPRQRSLAMLDPRPPGKCCGFTQSNRGRGEGEP